MALTGGKPPMLSGEASAEEIVERRWVGGPINLVGGVGSPLPSVWTNLDVGWQALAVGLAMDLQL